MKVGISISIDVTKLDKSRFFKGKKGTYVDLTTFVDLDNKNEYGDNGFISQSQTKKERDSGEAKTQILGNCKVFYREGEAPRQRDGIASAPQQAPADNFDDDSDIPF